MAKRKCSPSLPCPRATKTNSRTTNQAASRGSDTASDDAASDQIASQEVVETDTISGGEFEDDNGDADLEPPTPSKKPRVSFLALPAEIRNCIYEYALLKPQITIVSGLEATPRDENDLSRPSHCFPVYVRAKNPLTRPVHRRTSWRSVFLTSAGTRIRESEYNTIENEFWGSYQLEEGLVSNISLLGVNKQVRSEAVGIFFKRNLFVIKPRLEDICYAAPAFLGDIHVEQMAMLRNLHLDLPSLPPASIPLFRQPVKYHPPSWPAWKNMIKAVKALNLDHFGLTMVGYPTDRSAPDEPGIMDGLRSLGPFPSAYLCFRAFPLFIFFGAVTGTTISDVTSKAYSVGRKWLGAGLTATGGVKVAKVTGGSHICKEFADLQVTFGNKFKSYEQYEDHEGDDGDEVVEAIDRWEDQTSELATLTFWSV